MMIFFLLLAPCAYRGSMSFVVCFSCCALWGRWFSPVRPTEAAKQGNSPT
jgi:hypothetical protein